ncbi:hypothetical protein J4E85_002044 [Alternaria conjuncta]|uniref:uncharacterized protein n=2 Tax=Alternaria sect. Infectoriae TaxID=2499258 RepID=UPI0022205507|nr:uncharacterized protein J4E85_002044 [Alternaria conjuncta]KAI4934188.1 hypothetical protein J4E85_002044 [Alternaria conjuncta]
MAVPAFPAPDMSGVDPGLQPTLIALLYLFPGLALAVLMVRFWRKWQDHILGGDDVLIAIAWALALSNSVITHKSIDFLNAFKLKYALSLVYSPCIGFVKASFLWTLYKLRSNNVWIKRCILGLQAINTIFIVAFTILAAIPCWPIAKNWQPDLIGGCYDPLDYILANISIVLITDVLVLLIPTWIIWDLQMPLKRKIVTVSFLSLGLIVIAIGAVRFVWLIDAFKGKTKSYSVKASYSAIESSVAIIGTSGPTIKYILSRFIPWLRPSFERSIANKNSYDAYGNHSNVAARRARSHYGTKSGYDDLDMVSVHHEQFEMKSGWQKKRGRDEDARSDEQHITGEGHGINKTVEWMVDTKERSHISKTVSDDPNVANDKPATSPAQII